MTSNEIKNVIVRKAEVKDMPIVYQMIQELTEFEKLSNKIRLDAETLEKDYAENSQSFQCIVAEVPEHKLIGYAIYCQIYSTWDGKAVYLEDLYVKPEYRQHKIGKQLFISVMKRAHEVGCKRGLLNVLSWNPAVTFYKKLGATDITQTEDFHIFRIEQDAFQKLVNMN